MKTINSAESETPLMYILENSLIECFNRLNAILDTIGIYIDYINDKKKDVSTSFHPHATFFSGLGECIDKILEIRWNSSTNRLIENEIRVTLLSYNHNNHSEIYFLIIKTVLNYINKCHLQVERYQSNKKQYDNYISKHFFSMGEETPEYALKVLHKLVIQGSENFTNSLIMLSNSIISVLPQSVHQYVLPDDESLIFTNQKYKTVEPELTESNTKESDESLTASQKLLFIRLLQESGLFPRKPNNTDNAPELRGIALITGLSYKNDFKGNKGAINKVNQLLNKNERKLITKSQLNYKLSDLDAVENVARLLNIEPVITAINLIRVDLEKLRQS